MQVKISDILGMLKNGKTRDDIAKELNITKAQCKRMFQHPELKNKKTHSVSALPFDLVDDVSPSTEEKAMDEATDVEESQTNSPSEPEQGMPVGDPIAQEDNDSDVAESVVGDTPSWTN